MEITMSTPILLPHLSSSYKGSLAIPHISHF